MTLDYYRIFYYVARYKSFSNAAEMLGSNQPNITRCMNILENELDCKLLIRSHKGIQLTTEGEHLFRHVAIAIEQLTYGEKEIIHIRRKPKVVFVEKPDIQIIGSGAGRKGNKGKIRKFL